MLENLFFQPDWFKFWLVLMGGFFVIFLFDFILYPSFVYPKSKISFLNKFLRYFLSIFLIFAISLTYLYPKWIQSIVLKVEKTLNIQILLDVSLSMAADDISPSRFIVAKNSLADFISNLNGYNVSVILFSGWPIMWIPFTDEVDAAAIKLKQTKFYMVPPIWDFVGTALGNAMIYGIDNLLKYTKNKEKPGILLLLTDGDSNKGFDPVDVAKYAKEKGIKLYLLAIGKKSYNIAIRKDGGYERVTLNIENLKKIVDANGGNFYRILSEDDFKQVLKDIKNEIKTQEKKTINYNYFDLNKYLYGLVAILLIVNILFRIYLYFGLKNRV